MSRFNDPSGANPVAQIKIGHAGGKQKSHAPIRSGVPARSEHTKPKALSDILGESSRPWTVAYRMGVSAFRYSTDDTPPRGLSQKERDAFRAGYRDAWQEDSAARRSMNSDGNGP